MADTTVAPQRELRAKDPPRYLEHLEKLPEPARKLLEGYSGIEPDRVIPHVEEVRDRAWEIFPYPCIGMFRFLDLSLVFTPQYAEVVERLKRGDNFLDLGCCFGQEIRQLVADGVPGTHLYGSDLRREFWDLGHALFLDEGRLEASFVPGDVFDPASRLGELDGQIDVLHAASFFHLFSYEQQVQVAKRALKLLRPVKGSVIIGRQVGLIQPGVQTREGRGEMYRHNEETWRGLWERVGREVGVALEVEAELDEHSRFFFERLDDSQKGARRLRFTVRRV